MQKLINKKNTRIQSLKKKHENTLKNDNNKLKSTFNNFIFKNQLKLANVNKYGRRYKENQKSFALGLYYNSPKAYNFMRKYLCLPTVRSLRNLLQSIEVSCGLNINVLEVLKLKFNDVSPSEKLVSIIMDEMSLKRLISYNSQNDQFSGYVDFGTDDLVELKNNEYCDQALVIMIKSLIKPWKQILGYFFSKGPVSCKNLKDILAHTINKIIDVGLIPKIIICDQGTNNIGMRNLFRVTQTQPFISFNGENIYFFHDSPHLIKSVRNNFKKYDFVRDDELCSWSDLTEFYNLDKNKKPRLAPRLKSIHMNLPPFSSMRVCLATQTLSHSVSSGMMTLISLNQMKSSAIHTARFIEFFDNLFDVFNSITHNDPKNLRKPLTKNSCHWTFLNEAEQVLNKLKVYNRTGNLPPCIIGWKENITALRLLFNELNEKYSINFLMTRRLTQDCIENVFSILRAKGGNNITPDATKFHSAIRMCMCHNLLTPSQTGNCENETDAVKFFAKYNELKKVNLQLKLRSNINDDQHCNVENLLNLHLSPMNIQNILMENHEACAIGYITGWVCSQLTHQECVYKLAAKSEDKFTLENTHIEMKSYGNACLLFPFKTTLEYSKKITCIFNLNIEQVLLQKKIGVRKDMVKIIDIVCRKPLNICEKCKIEFLKKFLNVLINSYVKNCNNNLETYKLRTKNKKLRKIVHL